jgi:hypothetical protein
MADRIEREIEEILRKIDNFVPEGARRPARRAGQPFVAAQNWFLKRLARISLNQVMMWSLLLVVIGFFARGVPLGFWMMVGALIVFATAFLLSRLNGNHRPRVEKRWRGEPIDYAEPGWPDRIKAWLKGQRRA